MKKQIVVGNFSFLRNDYEDDLEVDHITYPTVEHAYQASKFTSYDKKLQIANLESVKEARRYGKTNKIEVENFDEKRIQIMKSLISIKFSDSLLAEKLAEFKGHDFIMNSSDTFWGIGVHSNGENHMGKILKEKADELGLIYNQSNEDTNTVNELTVGFIQYNPNVLDKLVELFNNSKELMKFVDRNDFDANFLSKRTGLPLSFVESAIKTLQNTQSTIGEIEDLVNPERSPIPDYVGSSLNDDDDDDY